MRTRILFLLCLVRVSGADPEAVQRKVTALTEAADRALASGKLSEAEEGYKSAIRECDSLPPSKYHCKTDELRKLGNLYSRLKDPVRAESVLKQRLAILIANHAPSVRPDVDIGIALFELMALIDADSTTTARDAEAANYMERARTFYEQCKAGFPDLYDVCDIRLADVEGIHGAALAVKKRFDDALPFLKAVVDRGDAGARRETMIAALNGYALILISRGQSVEAQEFVDRAKRLANNAKR
jgi:tetratricopeptide (TPR) repeat protein